MASYTLSEVQKHKSKDSLWVTVSGKVYDVTEFIQRHPGGWEILVEHSGLDVTSAMRGILQLQVHVHTDAAYEMLKKYYIGELDNGLRARSQRKHQRKAEKPNGTSNGTTLHKASNGHMSNGHGRSRVGFETNAYDMRGWREEELIDWNHPLVWQVGKLGKDYFEWVHSPVDKHVRLFHSDIAEFLTNTPWWMIPIVWLPTMFVIIYFGLKNFQHAPVVLGQSILGGITISIYFIPVLFVMGIVIWTLLEYLLHRWLFHFCPPANSSFFIAVHFLLHGQHHKAPFDKERLVFPPVPATVFALSFWLGYSILAPHPAAQILMAGTIFGYVCYDLTHYYLHHGTPWLAYFKRLKTYHVKHHFVEQQKGFGISSKLWDYPFNTLITDDA